MPTNLGPLLFVMFVSMLKDFFEDRKRRASDDEENCNPTKILCEIDGQLYFKEARWKEVKIGDIVRVEQDEFFPSDLICIKTASEKHIAYVETKNLDGETNLKHKLAVKELAQGFSDEESCLRDLHASVTCEAPNVQIYKFDGVLNVGDSKISLSHENLLLRGSALKNTEWVWGVVTYVGHETRLMMNS